MSVPQQCVRSVRFIVLAVALGSTACGKDGATPTSPSPPTTTAPPTPTVTSVTITGLDAVRTNFFSDYVATAAMSNGTTQTVTTSVTWSTSNATVASVDSNGRLSGRTHGASTLTASYEGRTATKAVNIVNNYGGTWTGSYTPSACDAAAAFASIGWCAGVVGVPVPLSLVLAQSGNDRSSVSGILTNAFVARAPVSGVVTTDGRLVLSADAQGVISGVAFRFQLGGWETRLTSAAQMTGRTAVNFSAIGVAGNAYEEHDITGATLSSPMTAPLVEK